MKIKEMIVKYLQEMKLLNRSSVTIKVSRYSLLSFARFLEDEEVYTIEELTSDIMEEYQQELAFRLTGKGKPLAVRSQEKHLCNARGFTRFLHEKDYLVTDPGARIKLPKQPKKLPKVILDHREIKQLVKAPDMQTNKGYRNRIILEMLYDTGIRAAEMARIKVSDLDPKNGYLHVRNGKGAKDRVVPVNARLCKLIDTYLLMVRPEMFQGKDQGYLVLNRWGTGMTPNAVWAIVKKCALLATIKKNVTPHTLRHTCATHMLKNGAPIRHIQELLGHESLESTQIYTRVTINDLKKIHAKYHPGENL